MRLQVLFSFVLSQISQTRCWGNWHRGSVNWCRRKKAPRKPVLFLAKGWERRCLAKQNFQIIAILLQTNTNKINIILIPPLPAKDRCYPNPTSAFKEPRCPPLLSCNKVLWTSVVSVGIIGRLDLHLPAPHACLHSKVRWYSPLPFWGGVRGGVGEMQGFLHLSAGARQRIKI